MNSGHKNHESFTLQKCEMWVSHPECGRQRHCREHVSNNEALGADIVQFWCQASVGSIVFATGELRAAQHGCKPLHDLSHPELDSCSVTHLGLCVVTAQLMSYCCVVREPNISVTSAAILSVLSLHLCGHLASVCVTCLLLCCVCLAFVPTTS